MGLFSFLTKLFKKKKTLRQLAVDDKGYVIANRQGVDTKPNEPYDCIAPPVRFENEEEMRQVRDHIEKQNSSLSR